MSLTRGRAGAYRWRRGERPPWPRRQAPPASRVLEPPRTDENSGKISGPPNPWLAFARRALR